MPNFSIQKVVAFSPRQMFDLVADVEKYPQFLPLCESITVDSREQAGTCTVLIATMGVGFKSIRERFTTRVTLEPAELRVQVHNLDGMFHHLENRWEFYARDEGALVEFSIAYSFRSPIHTFLVGGFVDKAFRRYIAAFEERAQEVYGSARIANSE